jgi:hypothetical protein
MTQIVARILEKALHPPQPKTQIKGFHLSGGHSAGPILSLVGQQYRKVKSKGMTISSSLNDSCCLMRDGKIVEVQNIVQTCDQNIWVVGQAYSEKSSFYNYPLDSSILGIFKVSKLQSSEKYRLKDIQKKMYRLPIKEEKASSYLCIPLLNEFECQ